MNNQIKILENQNLKNIENDSKNLELEGKLKNTKINEELLENQLKLQALNRIDENFSKTFLVSDSDNRTSLVPAIDYVFLLMLTLIGFVLSFFYIIFNQLLKEKI